MLTSIFFFVENQSHKLHQDIGISLPRVFKKPTSTYSKKSYSYFSATPSSSLSYYPYSYPYPAPAPYSYPVSGNSDTGNEVTTVGDLVDQQTSQYHCSSYPVTPGMNRTETFEINGKRKLRFWLQGRAWFLENKAEAGKIAW